MFKLIVLGIQDGGGGGGGGGHCTPQKICQCKLQAKLGDIWV